LRPSATAGVAAAGAAGAAEAAGAGAPALLAELPPQARVSVELSERRTSDVWSLDMSAA